MSPPESEWFKVQTIPNAGRGVLASKRIPAGTLILNSQPAAAHVIFRQYRKEVCAFCFAYDRGRTLAVRENEVGKVFCSVECQAQWVLDQGDVGVAAWRELQRYVMLKRKFVLDFAGLAPVGAKPGLDVIRATWRDAEARRRAAMEGKGGKRGPKANANQSVDPDILGLFLSGLLYHAKYPDKWRDEVLCLAMDEEPYKSLTDLEAHSNAFAQLASILPAELSTSLNDNVCQVLTQAGSHNAFGIRSGSEDGEEYMGYSLYPAASYFNHSCSPNIVKKRVGREWEFSSARDIEVGEECCITYLGGDEKDLTVDERRTRLSDVWGFKCMCTRCSTEASR
ncbi:Hypothetical protein R9X50_00056800 [Acrodontium crateriforme]|uniref:SET domain-containing protein n=1 Tax=Acrodontium crateriforme TaxID=150365 RepID=A0AAQ3M0I1_9PEZI|nr:Hypothetical protein R9X50_00056800 [Acrodontium crateriforme]